MRLTGARVFDPQAGFVERDLCIEGGKIVPDAGDPIAAADCFLIPGLTDLHFHGCRGADFSDGDPQGLETMAAYELSRGVTQICSAGMTLAAEQLLTICQTAAAHRAAGKPGAELVGVNLEGPFLSEAKKGAQNGAWLQKPSLPQPEALIEALVFLQTPPHNGHPWLPLSRRRTDSGLSLVISCAHQTHQQDRRCTYSWTAPVLLHRSA